MRKRLLKIYLEAACPMSLLQQEGQRMKLRSHKSGTLTLPVSSLLIRMTRMQSKSLIK
jgi:hypothetical protein